MRHVILTCKNHPDLRWSTKECAISFGTTYNGSRNLFFDGVPSGKGMYADGSGLNTSMFRPDGSMVVECDCDSDALIIAPEDVLVTR